VVCLRNISINTLHKEEEEEEEEEEDDNNNNNINNRPFRHPVNHDYIYGFNFYVTYEVPTPN